MDKIQTKERLTLGTEPQFYGCSSLFDSCVDDALMSLSYQGLEPFLDWLGWTPTNICTIKRGFIKYVRPEYSEGSATVGYASDPCADGNGTETDICDFTLTDFARLRRHSPVRDITKTEVRKCITSPRYRLDGSMIMNDDEYDMNVVTSVLLQDLKRMIIEGNAGTTGQFDGLERLVKTGYTDSRGVSCALMDSIVFDWNGNDGSGGSGITLNGNSVSATFALIDAILWTVRRIKSRIRNAGGLSGSRLVPGNMILLIPSDFATCILDLYTCWSVCSGSTIDTYEARIFRDGLNGGLYGAGKITIDGTEIHLMPFDFGLIQNTDAFDFYLLTGEVGNVRLLNGEYNDLRVPPTIQPDVYKNAAGMGSTDNGLILTWKVNDHTCYQRYVEMQPRLLAWAPWAQARFQNVKCTQVGGPFSQDPTSPYTLYP